MDFLKSIFNVFSRRRTTPEDAPAAITPELRNRVLMLTQEVLGSTGFPSEFWEQVHQKLRFLHGTAVLSPESHPSGPAEDVLNFLLNCESEHFLDFVELIFQVRAFWRVSQKQELVDQINTFLDVDDLPYHLTAYVEVERSGSYRGQATTYIEVGSYPRVVLKEHQLVHSEALEPVLELLADPRFSSANEEFLDGLRDYRHGDYGDCLTKCGSSFESVMKVLCDNRGWAYSQTDTASRLLDTIVNHTGLDGFFVQPLMLVATLRNRMSKSHGAGTTKRVVPRHVAQFAVNATAAGILLLVQEVKSLG